MGFQHYISFSLILLTITTLLSTNVGATGNPAKLCKHTDFPILCKSMLKGITGAADATQSAIHATILQTTLAKSMAKRLSASQDNMGKANLKVCTEVYDDAISNLITSIKNLKDKAHADLKINLSAAMSDFSTCDDGFTENPGSVSPLAKVNELLHQLTSNSLAFASELKN